MAQLGHSSDWNRGWHTLFLQRLISLSISLCICFCEPVGIFMVVSFQFSCSLKVAGLHSNTQRRGHIKALIWSVHPPTQQLYEDYLLLYLMFWLLKIFMIEIAVYIRMNVALTYCKRITQILCLLITLWACEHMSTCACEHACTGLHK